MVQKTPFLGNSMDPERTRPEAGFFERFRRSG
jgi:hypothetical protein